MLGGIHHKSILGRLTNLFICCCPGTLCHRIKTRPLLGWLAPSQSMGWTQAVRIYTFIINSCNCTRALLLLTLLLCRFAKSIDINDKDPVVHKHTPYIVILVRLAEKWADAHDGNLPSTSQEKREFKVHSFYCCWPSKRKVFLGFAPKLFLLSGPDSGPYA